MNKIPLVTIGITCFNAEGSIAKAIESALGQTYSNTEIVVIDDASIDNSVKVISQYEEENEQVKLIQHKKNKGAPTAYNSIIENANGKYIVFFDDDDFSHPDRVEKTALALEDDNSGKLVCFCDRYVQSNNNKRIIKGLTRPSVSSKELIEHMLDTLCYQYDRDYYRKNRKRFFPLKQHNLEGSSAGTGIMTAPVDILKKHLFDPKMHRFCDTELNLRMFQDGVGAINIDTPLMTQTVTSGSDKTSIVEKESAFHALLKHKKTYQLYGVYYSGIFSIDDDFNESKISDKTKLPLVTIGIVTENSEDTIFEVVKNALSQTYSNIEVIIVDNMSSDSTLDILSRIDDSRLIITRNKNKVFKSQSLNEIISRANGEFVVLFSDKDIALKCRVQSQINSLVEKGENIPTLSVADYYDNTNGTFVGVHHCLGSLGSDIDSETLQAVIWHILVRHSEAKYLLTESSIPFFEYSLFAELICGRTEILKEIGFDSSNSENMSDLQMLIKFSEMGGEIINKREPLVHKITNPLRCGPWTEVVEETNFFIQSNKEMFEKIFNVNSDSIIYRNNLKMKLLKRMSFIRKYL